MDFLSSVGFNGWSWVVIAIYMIFTTLLGHFLSGKQSTIKDFFLGGRKLPWYAVSGSIIATELSAMTLVGAPAFLWAATGNMEYAVLAFGVIIARIIVGFWFVPKYYEEEIYSPYEYIGNQLGMRAQSTTSVLFMIGGMMGQGTRVLLTAIVLQVVTGINVYTSIWIVGAVAVLWTVMGGMTTVIWTDFIQFLIFTFSAILMFYVAVTEFHTEAGAEGWSAIYNLGMEYGKFKWLDWRLDITDNYTIWSSLIASTIGGLAAYGTDQMMAQRSFCCKGPKEARLAIIASSASQILMLICLFVGLALWAYYKHSGLEGVPNTEEWEQITENANRLVPVFVKFRVNWIFGGLIVAGIFAAAISSLDSILAALSQQTLAAVRGKKGEQEGGLKDIALSRMFVLGWAVVLCGMASLFWLMADSATLLIELALAVVGYTWGGILGAFLMAIIPSWRRKAKGIEYAAALSVITIFAITRNEVWSTVVIGIAFLIMIISAFFYLKKAAVKVAIMIPYMAFILALSIARVYVELNALEDVNIAVGWPWYAPLGCLIMVSSAMLICEPMDSKPESTSAETETQTA